MVKLQSNIRDPEQGRGTRLGWFYGYKFYVIVSENLEAVSKLLNMN